MGIFGGKALHGVMSLKFFQIIVKILMHLFNIMHLTLKPILLTRLRYHSGNFLVSPILQNSDHLFETDFFQHCQNWCYCKKGSLKLLCCLLFVCVYVSGVGGEV